MALRLEQVERGLQPVERARGVGDMVGIKVDEVLGQPVEVADADGAAVDLEPAFEELAGAGADHVARLVQRHRRQALAVEYEIERRDQVGRGVDEGAVEIEYKRAGEGHREFAIRGGGFMQVGKSKLLEELSCVSLPAGRPL